MYDRQFKEDMRIRLQSNESFYKLEAVLETWYGWFDQLTCKSNGNILWGLLQKLTWVIPAKKNDE